MATLEQLLASVGIGAATLTLRVDGKRFVRGTRVHGTLDVAGGDVAQRVETLSIALADSGATNHHHQQILASSLVVQPNSRHDFAFSFVIPDNTHLPELH